MKLCSKTTCTRHHDTKYKTCEVCRENVRRCMKKRKRLAEDLKVPEGMRMCKNWGRGKLHQHPPLAPLQLSRLF